MKIKDGNMTGEEQKIEREDKICSLPSPTLRRFAPRPLGRIRERIWLHAFGTPTQICPSGKLRIRARRYQKF